MWWYQEAACAFSEVLIGSSAVLLSTLVDDLYHLPLCLSGLKLDVFQEVVVYQETDGLR